MANELNETERMSGRRRPSKWLNFKVRHDEVMIRNVENRVR